MLSFTRRLAPATLNIRRLSTASRPAPPPPLPERDLSEGEQVIRAKLAERFTPSELLVQDVSGVCTAIHPYGIHLNQPFSAGGCGSFYAITIASEAFKGLPTVKQHRLVTETLKEEIQGIHGLQVSNVPHARVASLLMRSCSP